MTALQINQLVYDPGSLSLTWIGDGVGAATPFTVTLTPGTGQAQTFPATGFGATIPVTLANTSWTASVAPTAGGAASAPVPILLVAPTVSRVQNSGSSLDVDWQQVAGTNSYGATLIQLGHSSTTQTVTGLTTSFDVSLSGDGWTCAVRAATPDFVSFGPGASYQPILSVPALSLVSYSGSDLSLHWTTVPPYTTYYACLQAGSAAPQTQSVSDTSATFEGQLAAGSHSTWVCVQSADHICIGPPSQIYEPITVSPTMTAVTYDGAKLTLSWTAAPGFPRNLALLQVMGSGSQQQSVRGTSSAFSGPLTGVGKNKCLVSAQSEDQVNIGPPAAVYTVIVTAPQLQEFDYDSGTIGVQWSAASDPTVSGNQLVVSGSGQPLQIPLDTSGSQTVAGTLTEGATYGAVVRATDGIVAGPAGETVVPLTSPPKSLRLGFDGTHLQAIWTAAAGSGVSGYLAELSKNSASLETKSSTALQQQFDSGLDADAVFTARTRATGTKVKGPWSATATGPYRTTRTYGFDPLGRIESVGWSSGASEAYSFDSAGNLLTYTRTAAPPPSPPPPPPPSAAKRRK